MSWLRGAVVLSQMRLLDRLLFVSHRTVEPSGLRVNAQLLAVSRKFTKVAVTGSGNGKHCQLQHRLMHESVFTECNDRSVI